MTLEFHGFDYQILLGVGVVVALLFNLAAALIALRRAQGNAHSAAALVAELAVYKDAALTLGEQLGRRGGSAQSAGSSRSESSRSVSTSSLPVASSGAVNYSPRAADASAGRQGQDSREPQQPHSESALSVATMQLPDTERAVELARRGASVDDLVAACDVSRTEAGLILAMARRGRSFVGRPVLGSA